MDKANQRNSGIAGGSGLLPEVSFWLAFLVYQFFFADKRSKLNVEQDKLTISTVNNGEFDEFIVVTGVVQPLKTIQLDAIVGGYVTRETDRRR